MFLSVITPTFNRAYTLQRCYDSLLKQTDYDFEWIIVDDGSSDNTNMLVKKFMADDRITIQYIYQTNGGKQRAHNAGVKAAKGVLSICLDSDDALSPDAVETVKLLWNDGVADEHIGILAKRGDFGRHLPICGDWPKSLRSCKMQELQERYGFTGDTALFFKTDLLKKHYFKVFENEKFVPEDSLYVQLDDCGKMILSPKVLYYCEYLEDGLTANYRKMLLSNPMGTAYCYYQRMLRSQSWISLYKNAIISQAFLMQARRKAEFECREKAIVWMSAKLFAIPYRIIRKMNVEE